MNLAQFLTDKATRNKRLARELAGMTRSDGVVYRNVDYIVKCVGEMNPVKLEISDATINYNRRAFNRMDYREQAAYMERLASTRYYWVNDHKISKTLYDAIAEYIESTR